MNLSHIDNSIIHFLRKAFIPTARFSIFVVYVWFGALKILGVSPAGALVHGLFDNTIHFMTFNTFYVLFAWFEVLIGIMFIIPKATRYVLPLLFIHMITTFMPLIFLPEDTWSGFMVLTLTGQYIVKNLVIVALAIGVAAQVHPLPLKNKAQIGH